MWELQPRLRAAVDALLAQWRRDRPGGTRRGDGLTVGMHYRCGDSNFGDSPERWERFIRAAKEMQARYGAARIFLATDSPPAAVRPPRESPRSASALDVQGCIPAHRYHFDLPCRRAARG